MTVHCETEYRHGAVTLATGELFGGLDRHAAGEWRRPAPT